MTEGGLTLMIMVGYLPSWPLKPQNKCMLFPTLVFHLILYPCRAQKSKSAKASCCSSERMKGLEGGDRIGWSRVNSLSKLLTSIDSLIDGRNGGFIFLASRASQSMVWKMRTVKLSLHIESYCQHKMYNTPIHFANKQITKVTVFSHKDSNL